MIRKAKKNAIDVSRNLCLNIHTYMNKDYGTKMKMGIRVCYICLGSQVSFPWLFPLVQWLEGQPRLRLSMVWRKRSAGLFSKGQLKTLAVVTTRAGERLKPALTLPNDCSLSHPAPDNFMASLVALGPQVMISDKNKTQNLCPLNFTCIRQLFIWTGVKKKKERLKLWDHCSWLHL